MPCRSQNHNEKSLTVGSTSWIGRDRVVFHGKRFSGALIVAGLNADRYPSGSRRGYRRCIWLVRATAPGVGFGVPQNRGRRSDCYSTRSSASSSDTSQHPKSSTSALSLWHLLPNLPELNRRRGVHAWETESQALAIANLTANNAVESDARQERPRAPHRGR
jgi:hypothetical protein